MENNNPFLGNLVSAKAALRDSFAATMLKEMCDRNITDVFLYGYTPYFNDGESCEFSMHGMDSDEIQHHFELSDEDLDAVIEKLYKKISDSSYESGRYVPAVYTPEAIQYSEFVNVICDASEIFRMTYGDHQVHWFKVRDGVLIHTSKNYEHD